LQHAGGLDLYALYVDGVIQYAEMVHHIVPLSEDWSNRCDQRNLFPLTNANHNKIEALYDASIAEKKQTQQLLRRLLERFEAEQRGGAREVWDTPGIVAPTLSYGENSPRRIKGLQT